MQGVVHGVCFKPSLQELLLAFTLKFSNVGVETSLHPPEMLGEVSENQDLSVQLKQIKSFV